MSRLARRRLLTLAATTAAVLAVPAAASAATYTVSPGAGGCGSGDLACGGLAEAAAAVIASDTVNVSPGAYPGATFNVGGLTITGASGVLITSTVEFTAGAVSKLSKVAVAQTGAADGVRVTGTSAGIELSDAIVVSQGANGVLIAAGTSSKILRSLVTAGTGPSAIRITSAIGAAARTVLIESTIAGGGVSGVGAVTTGGLLGGAGAISLTMHHVTAAGTTNGILLDSSAGSALGGGSITAIATDSIALNNRQANFVGLLGVGTNAADLTTTRTLTTGDKATIFANPNGLNFRLRPDAAAAIGQGSVVPGESTADFEGEDRSTAPTDLGGDEFNNAPPVAKFVVATKTPRATQAVRFDATTSTDRETGYGGGIVQYQWLYSDGTGQTTTTPTVDHVFAKEGNAAVQLTVVDAQGAASAPVALGLVLVDGTAPFVSIVKPKNKAKIKLFTTKTNKKTKKKTKTRTKIVFGGLSKDANGVAGIILTLEKLKTKAPATGSSAKASAATTTARCTWYDPRKGLKVTSCLKPSLITARLIKDSKTGEWTYSVNKNLSKGTYRLTALGVDKAGVFGNAGGSKLGVIRFTLS